MLTYSDLYKRVRQYLYEKSDISVRTLIDDYEYGEGEDLDFIVSLAFEQHSSLPSSLCNQLLALQEDYKRTKDFPLPLSTTTHQYLTENDT